MNASFAGGKSLTLYSSELHRGRGQSFFGSMEPGIRIDTICELFLVREVGGLKRAQAVDRYL